MSNQGVNLVAGVAGFVGAHLAEAILQKGYGLLPVNIGNSAEVTMIELATMIKHLAGSKSRIVQSRPLPEDDPLIRKPDISRAKQLLGWEPRISPEDGLKKTINWFKTKIAI